MINSYIVTLSDLLEDEYFDEDAGLAWLLLNETCFTNSHGETVVCFVLCNDLFVWGAADAENLPRDEIEGPCKHILADRAFGSDIWCCKRRRQRPQKPVIERMKAAGSWTDEMEALPKGE